MTEASGIISPFLFIGVLFLIAVLLGLIFYVRGKPPPPLSSKGKGESLKRYRRVSDATTQTLPHPLSSQSLAQRMVLEETGMVIPELSGSEPSAEFLRKRVEQGVDSIFASKQDRFLQKGFSGRLENLDSNIHKTVLHHIDHFKNFRPVSQLYKTLDDPNVSLSELSKIIVTDPILTGRILKLANSAYFGMQQKVNSIGPALMIIGLLNIKTILYQEGLLKLLKSKHAMDSLTVESLWEHAVLTSICASHLQGLFGGLDKGTFFTLGLLHDIGKFVMHDLPMRGEDAAALCVSTTEFTFQDEEEIYGVNHAIIGRLLFDQWGFPEQMGSIIERHHDLSFTRRDPTTIDNKELKYLLIIFLSNQIAKIFASEDKSTSAMAPLSSEWSPRVSRQKLLGLVIDSSLFSEIKKAKLLAKSQ